MTTYGTAYFVSREAAVKYYANYEHDPDHAVTYKLREQSIHIGKPDLKPGQVLSIIDGGLRYAVTEAPTPERTAMMKTEQMTQAERERVIDGLYNDMTSSSFAEGCEARIAQSLMSKSDYELIAMANQARTWTPERTNL